MAAETPSTRVPAWMRIGLVLLTGVVLIQSAVIYGLMTHPEEPDMSASQEADLAASRVGAASSAAPPSNSLPPAAGSKGDPLLRDDILDDRLSWERDPWKEIERIQERMDRLFEGSGPGLWTSSIFDLPLPPLGSSSTRADVRETDEAFEVVVDLPGAEAGSIETRIDGQILRISAQTEARTEERQEGEGTRSIRRERSFGRIEQSIPLGRPVDPTGMRSSYEDGVLRIIIPKRR